MKSGKGHKRPPGAPATPPGLAALAKRLPGVAAAAAAPPAAPAAAPEPKALPLTTRHAIAAVLAAAEKTIPALRNAGQFGVLGLMAQTAHALKLCAEHCHVLERALGLEPEPPAPPAPTSNGVTGQ